MFYQFIKISHVLTESFLGVGGAAPLFLLSGQGNQSCSLVYSTQTPYTRSIDAILVVAGIPALQPIGRSGPRPASIPALLSGAGASSPPGRKGSRPACWRMRIEVSGGLGMQSCISA